jgi:hypothetical protein
VITGVDFVYVPTRDFDRAARFYGEVHQRYAPRQP